MGLVANDLGFSTCLKGLRFLCVGLGFIGWGFGCWGLEGYSRASTGLLEKFPCLNLGPDLQLA